MPLAPLIDALSTRQDTIVDIPYGARTPRLST